MRARTVAKIVGGLFAVIIVAALAAPAFISSDTIKAQLIAQVKKATGRTLEINGDTSVRFFPNIEVVAEDVSLSNPAGFTTPQLISLKKLATGAELRPLLRGELLINGITLDGAVIHLEETKDGAKNWEFTTEKVKETAEDATDAPEAQKKSSSPIKRFALGDIVITDSAISYIKPNAEVIELKAINLTLQGADANSPLKLEGSADYRGEQVSLALDVAKPRDFLDAKASPVIAALKLPGASLDFNGSAEMGESIGAKGKLNVNATALPKVLAWATGKPAAGALPKQVTVKADTAYADKTLSLSDATLRVDDVNATGALSVNHSGSKPSIRGNLAFTELDLDAITGKSAEPNTNVAGGVTSKASNPSTGWSTAPVDLSGLKAVNADVDASWQKLTSGKLTVGATKLNANLQDGKLALTIANAALYNGALSGVVNASSGGSIGADVNMTGIDIEALMTALSGKSRLEGKTNLALAVTAKGKSQSDWVNSLNGSGSLKVVDGALKGINIGQFLRDAKQGFLFKSESESTDFTDLTGSFNIASGVLTNTDLAMKSPALRLAGEGTVNLPAKTLNYRLTPTLAQTSKGQGGKDSVAGITVPLVITGSWSNPSVTPDLEAMLRDPEALKENIKNIGETIKDFNSKDDLKRALLGGGKTDAAPAEATSAPAAASDAGTTAAEPQPVAAPSKKEQRQKLIEEGVGSLLKGL
ncbi:MAG: hypothetical protein DI582_06965 [Azospirillum brasilense]|nr:MAG: hypothetical protein DI582_06965 [Azospirillum brasilense]